MFTLVTSQVLEKAKHRIQTADGQDVELCVTKCPLQLEKKYLSIPSLLLDASIDSEAKRQLFHDDTSDASVDSSKVDTR